MNSIIVSFFQSEAFNNTSKNSEIYSQNLNDKSTGWILCFIMDLLTSTCCSVDSVLKYFVKPAISRLSKDVQVHYIYIIYTHIYIYSNHFPVFFQSRKSFLQGYYMQVSYFLQALFVIDRPGSVFGNFNISLFVSFFFFFSFLFFSSSS